jgi:hypothetical protein
MPRVVWESPINEIFESIGLGGVFERVKTREGRNTEGDRTGI